MKWRLHLKVLSALAAVLFALPGCNDLPTTGMPIAGTPDGKGEVMKIATNGEIQVESIGFLAAVDRQDQKLVLVDFWAPWCGYCHELTPEIEATKKKWGDKLEVVKVNYDENPAIITHMRVHGIPDVRIFRNGIQVGDFVGGGMKADEISALLRTLE